MTRLVAWAACALTVTFVVARVVLKALDPLASDADDPFGGGVPLALFDGAVLLGLAVLGTVVMLRVPRNAVGWILSMIPLSLAILLFGHHVFQSLVAADGPGSDRADLVGWVLNWVWIPFAVPALVLLPLLFPTGRPLTARWRVVGWMAAGAAIASFVGIAFTAGALQDPVVQNPFGTSGALGTAVGVVSGVGFALMIVAALGAVASLVLRFSRSRAEERQQLKWFAAAIFAFVVMFLFPTDKLVGDDLAFVSLLLGLALVEAAVALAMLRYRLYDIDVVINRAVVYTTVTGVLAGTYFLSVLLLQAVLSPSSDVAVAGSTLAVAGLFRPARASVQDIVDRRFYRQRYDAEAAVAAFTVRARDQVSLDALHGDLRDAVTDALQPAHVSVWMRQR